MFAFRLASLFAFSHEFDKEESQELSQALFLVHRSQRLLSILGHAPWVCSIARHLPYLLKDNANFTQLAHRMIECRRLLCPKVPDLFTFLLATENNPEAAGFPLNWQARLALVTGRSV